MTSIRPRERKDGTIVYAVRYLLDGRETSTTFDNKQAAAEFKRSIDIAGPERAMDIHGIPRTHKAAPTEQWTVESWLTHHVEHLTGIEQKSRDDYARYIREDIVPTLGAIPLSKLTEHDIGAWVARLETAPRKKTNRKPSPKTIKNIHGFLSGALAAAVPKHIPANPAAGRRLPRGEGDDDDVTVRMLSRDEFNRLLEATTEYWRPLLEFMVTSGMRWGEVAALKPGDINRTTGLVRIRRAWKYNSSGYVIGPPKTQKSKLPINVPLSVLRKLDYSNEWLFVNRDGGPVRYYGFRRRIWDKAVARAKLDPRPTPHDLRHTCASWMLNAGVPITVVSRHLRHESIKTTVDLYGDLDRTVAAAAADLMGELLAKSKAVDVAPLAIEGAEPTSPRVNTSVL